MKKTFPILTALAVLAGAFLHAADAPAPANSTASTAVPSAPAAAANTTSSPEVIKIKPYRLDVCIVSGDKIGTMGKPLVVIQDGQEVKFCCSDCPGEFAKDPAKYLKLIAEAEKKLPAAPAPAKESPLKPYPLDVCVVMNKKIGSMGAPVVIQYNSQEIKLCCKDCLPSFNKDPMAVLKRISDAQPKPAGK